MTQKIKAAKLIKFFSQTNIYLSDDGDDDDDSNLVYR
jgi:hypothetical protein